MYTNKQIGAVSFPIFLGLLAQNVIGVTDTAFLGRVGEVELGASAMGGLYYICAFTIAFGFSTGSQIVIARRNGEGHYDRIGPVMIQGVLFLLLLAMALFGFSRLFVDDMMRVLISSDAILKASVDFLNWRVFGFFFSFITLMYRALFVGITQTKVLTLNAVVMAVVNILLDYLLIFGHAGLPCMGLQGAAIASVIAEATSVFFFVIYTRMAVDRHKYALDRFHSFDFELLRRVFSISVFMMIQYFLSFVTWFVFFIVVERLGERPLAVANIVRSIYGLMLVPINALATTTNTFVSNSMGAGESAQVIPVMKRICKCSLGVMVVFSLFVGLNPEWILSIYTTDASLVEASVPSVYAICLAMLVGSVGSVVFNGVSGTGDTRAALLMEMAVLSLYALFVYVVGMCFRLPVGICFFSELIYWGGLVLAGVLYFTKASWQDKRV